MGCAVLISAHSDCVSLNYSGGLSIGEELVVEVKNDPAFPHARFKCTMCDCYFNDDYARRMHVKGRRHRLNFKKTYQPDLFVEPTKQQKKEIEKRRKSVEQRRGERRGVPMGGGGGGPPDIDELRRQEAAELARMYSREVRHILRLHF